MQLPLFILKQLSHVAHRRNSLHDNFTCDCVSEVLTDVCAGMKEYILSYSPPVCLSEDILVQEHIDKIRCLLSVDV